MKTLNTLIDRFNTTSTLANAKALVAHVTKYPALTNLITEDHAGAIRNAERILADSKDPKKLKEAMQAELRARYKGMNIIVC